MVELEIFLKKHPIVEAKIAVWSALAQNREISMWGWLKVISPKEFILMDVFMVKQTGSSAENDMDNISTANLWARLHQEKGLQPGDLRCHIHTHPHMTNSKSSIDESAIKKDFSKFDFIVTGIYGNNGDEFYLDTFKPFRQRTKLTTNIDFGLLFKFPISISEDDINKEFNENFSIPKPKVISPPTISNQFLEESYNLYPSRAYARPYRPEKNIEINTKNQIIASENNTKNYAQKWNEHWNRLVEYLKDMFDKQSAYELNMTISNSTFFSDQWKPGKNNPNTIYGDFGITEHDLQRYAAVLVLIESFEGRYRSSELNKDIRLWRCEQYFGLLETAEEAMLESFINYM